MTLTRSLSRITALLCFAMLVTGSSTAFARRRPGPTATPGGPTGAPIQNPDSVLQNQLITAGSLGANDLRSCDRFLSRAGTPLPQVRFTVRAINGSLQVDGSQNRGGSQYVTCLQTVMGNATLQAAQSLN